MSGEAMGPKPISRLIGTKCGGCDDVEQAKPERECWPSCAEEEEECISKRQQTDSWVAPTKFCGRSEIPTPCWSDSSDLWPYYRIVRRAARPNSDA